MFRLVRRNFTRHLMRSLLSVGSLALAMLLLCVLQSLLVALDAGVKQAKRDRLIVQSAVSLFVDLPLSYQQKIDQVPGVARTCKFQWFAGWWQDPDKSFFAQFAVDAEPLLDMYPELELLDGDDPAGTVRKRFLEDRQGCLVGDMLAQELGWKVGEIIPIVSRIFPGPGDSGDDAWPLRISGLYHSRSSAVDNRTVYFHWDFFQKGIESGAFHTTPGCGLFSLRMQPGATQTIVQASIEELFTNGPQRVSCPSEAEFQAQFASMVGNIPFLVGSIGGGVLVAIVLACVNTMLMALREQTHDLGILKALGFTDGATARLLLMESLFLSVLGGGTGLLIAKIAEPVLVMVIGTMFPGFAIRGGTLVLGVVLTILIGLIAGLLPALFARRLQCVAALRAVE